MSVLYVSHGHPAFAKGGGELAAWRLFEAFRSKPGFEGSGFLAAASSPDQLPAGSELLGLGPDEWLIKRSTSPITHDTAVDLSEGSQLHQALIARNFQIIHLHHYLHVGIDLVFALKRWFPQAKFFLTLHDYWGPCVYEGRLLRASGELCDGGDPMSCDQCLGGDRRSELAIRALRLQRMFGLIDQFLCPSYFLKQRYLVWGVDSRKLSVIENLPAERPQHVSQPVRSGPLVVGYFGQVNRWKGLSLLIDALGIARARGAEIQLEVNGVDQENPPDGVVFNGRYRPDQLADRMARVDVVAMASIWFENSPMVIQEAFLHGRPVIAPRLGGMAEKITHQKTGLLFEFGNRSDLAEQYYRLWSDKEMLSVLRQNVMAQNLKRPDLVEMHHAVYQRWGMASD